MDVIALKPCYAGKIVAYRKVGDIFEIDETRYQKGKDGQPVFSKSKTPPFKVVKDPAKAKAEAEKIKADAEAASLAAAIAASGGDASKAKADALAKELAG